MKTLYATLVFALAFGYALPLGTVMTSTDYVILEDNFSTIDEGTVSGGNFELFDSFGDFPAGTVSSTSFELQGGFYFPGTGTISCTVSPTTIALGTLSTGSVSTDSLVLTVTTDSASGYATTVTEDGNLRSGGDDIDDVSDGSVTAGAEEYGIVTSGGNGQLGADTAIDGSVTVASKSSEAEAVATTVTFNASRAAGTVAGSYSHIVTFTCSANP